MINFNFTLLYTEIYIIFINIASFIIYGYDKLQAIRDNKNISRVPEKVLLLLSFFGGIVGSIAAMILFRHKIKKLSFLMKFFVTILLQIIIGYGYYYFKI